MKETLGTGAILIAMLAWLGASAQATTITVNSIDDSGAGTLRDALANAADNDTIDASGVSGIITLTNGQLNVLKSVTILGPGANVLAVDGNATSRVFYISPGLTVTIADLTVTNGFVDDLDTAGGIHIAQSTLLISNCVVAGNHGYFGGGIYNDGLSGGGLVEIINSTISGNSATYGGGLDNDGEGAGGNAVAQIFNSTFSGNFSDTIGGAIINFGYGEAVGSVTILNSTFSDNHSINFGDGILNWGDAGGSAPIDIGSTILNDSLIVNYGGSGTINSLGYNLSSDDGAGFLTSSEDQTNTNPMLGPLQLNGGHIPTHALFCGSPAIDAGTNFTGTVTDQRGSGFSRTVDLGRAKPLGGDGTDIGAYELQARSDLALSMAATKTSLKGQITLTYTITVTNSGPGTASNIIVSDPVPPGTLFASASANRGRLTTPAVGATGTVTWSVGSLLASNAGAAQIKVTVVVKGNSLITNTATVTSDTCDFNTANNTATVSVSTKGK